MTRIKPTLTEHKEVVKIMNSSREQIFDNLVKLIRRINYLEGEEFYLSIRKDVLKEINFVK